jgi:predicted nucleotide-binding protein
MEKRSVFISYRRSDAAIARNLYDGLKSQDFDVKMDIESIRPGEDFKERIASAISTSEILLILVSKETVCSISEFQELELRQAIQFGLNPFVVTIDMDVASLPPNLKSVPSIDYHTYWDAGYLDKYDELEYQDFINRLSHTLRQLPKKKSDKEKLEKFAYEVADSAAAELRELGTHAHAERSVFVVHGRDDGSLQLVEDYLKEIGIKPIILTRMGGGDRSLLQRFLRFGNEANFAVVLITADDYGAFCGQYDTSGVEDRALQFRARQNVILELSFFYGKLGWENVFVLFKGPDRAYPNFERPSDLEGVVFNELSNASWKKSLRERLDQLNISPQA